VGGGSVNRRQRDALEHACQRAVETTNPRFRTMRELPGLRAVILTILTVNR
jgi:hypothetical protein